jgi:hypothetical protein
MTDTAQIAYDAAKRLSEDGVVITYNSPKLNQSDDKAKKLSDEIRSIWYEHFDKKHEYLLSYNLTEYQLTLDKTITLVTIYRTHHTQMPPLVPINPLK